MKIIKKIPIDDITFVTSSPIAEYSTWASGTTYNIGDLVRVASSTYTPITVSIASPCIITFASHGLKDGQVIKLTTTGALPTGLVNNGFYYVRSLGDDTFNLSATLTGQLINTSGSQSGVHSLFFFVKKLYESLQNNNLANKPWVDASASWWLELGYTNPWRMFDDSISSISTENDGAMTVSLETYDLLDTIAFLNVSCSTIQVKLLNGATTIYDQTVSMIATDDLGIYGATYRKNNYIFSGLPNVSPSKTSIEITLSDTVGNTISLGLLLIGNSIAIGGTQYGATLGIQDYSFKKIDEFGNYSVLQRGFSKTGSFDVWVDNIYLDQIYDYLSQIRSTPILALGTDTYASTFIYGFIKDYGITLQMPAESILTLTMEGLT